MIKDEVWSLITTEGEKKRLTVALTCTRSGRMLPTVVIFKGKRKLNFVKSTVEDKGWMVLYILLIIRCIIIRYNSLSLIIVAIFVTSHHRSCD